MVTSLKLKNYGHSDAENITINAKFTKPLLDISVNDRSMNLVPISGGKGKNYISGYISGNASYLVPGQEIFIYFAIDNSDTSISASDELPKNFISQITFKGGKGKTGQPIIWGLLILIVVVILGLISCIKMLNFSLRKTGLSAKEATETFNRAINFLTSPEYFNIISQIKEIVNQAISKGDSRAIFEDHLNKHLKDKNYPKILQEIGLKIFDSKKSEK